MKNYKAIKKWSWDLFKKKKGTNNYKYSPLLKNKDFKK